MATPSGRKGSRTWAREFEGVLDGACCPICEQGRPDDDGHGLRIYAGELVDAYLQRRSALAGWTAVIWRGAHVGEPMDMSPEDACT